MKNRGEKDFLAELTPQALIKNVECVNSLHLLSIVEHFLTRSFRLSFE